MMMACEKVSNVTFVLIIVWWKQEGANAGMHAPLYEHSLRAIEVIGSWKRG